MAAAAAHLPALFKASKAGAVVDVRQALLAKADVNASNAKEVRERCASGHTRATMRVPVDVVRTNVRPDTSTSRQCTCTHPQVPNAPAYARARAHSPVHVRVCERAVQLHRAALRSGEGARRRGAMSAGAARCRGPAGYRAYACGGGGLPVGTSLFMHADGRAPRLSVRACVLRSTAQVLETPLLLAAFWGHAGVARALLQARADPSAKNKVCAGAWRAVQVACV